MACSRDSGGTANRAAACPTPAAPSRCRRSAALEYSCHKLHVSLARHMESRSGREAEIEEEVGEGTQTWVLHTARYIDGRQSVGSKHNSTRINMCAPAPCRR